MNKQHFNQTLRFQVYLESFKQSEVDKMTPRLQAIDKLIRERLLGDELADLTVKSFKNIMTSIKKDLGVQLDLFEEDLSESLTELGLYTYEYEVKSMANAYEGVKPTEAGIEVIAAKIDKTPLAVRGAEGRLITDLFKGFKAAETERYLNNISLARHEGKTNAEIAQMIRGTKKQGYRDGLISVTSRQANTITRTTVHHAAMQAKREFSDQNSDIIVGEKIVATLDSRTTPICRDYDGQVFKPNKGRRPPFHYNCRSTYIYVLDKRYAGKGEVKTRASVNGTTKNVTYYDWLKEQPVSFQDDVLGPTRAKLFRDGGLTVKQFKKLQLDKNFKPLTLEQMREREPQAFDKARL